MKTTLKGLLLLAAMLLAVSTAQAAIDTAKVQKLLAQDRAAGDIFGYSVAMSGDTAIVGARSDDSKRGAAYIFTRASNGSWSQQQKLIAADGATDDEFGYSVAISDDTQCVVIGSLYNDGKGSAYVFIRASDGTWLQQAKLTASDGIADDLFGYSVAVSAAGNIAFVTAVWDDDKGSSSGSAYVFIRAVDGTWLQQAKLLAPDGATSDLFGASVAVSDNTIVIGANGNAGSAYVFVRATDGTWMQQAKLTASDGIANDWFGGSVALSSNTVVIGAYGDDDKGTYSGSAYVFVRSGSTWTQQAKLTATDGTEYDRFGMNVALSVDTAVIGAAWNTTGSAYVFVRSGNTWTQQAKLTATDGAEADFFGRSVAVDGNTVVIGAIGDDERKGAAYVFGGPSVNMAPVYNLLLKR